MNKRRLLILIAGGIGLVLVMLISFFLLFTRQHLIPSQPFASGFEFAKQIDDKTVYYFNNSSFVSYNVDNYMTTGLTPIYSLPNFITSIKWSNRGALVHATGYSALDQLYTTLVENGLSPNTYYWWLFDFSSGKYRLIGDVKQGADVRSVIWLDDSTFIYTQKNETKLNVIRDSGGQTTLLADIPDGAELASATDKQLIYTAIAEHLSQLVTLDLSSKKITKIADNVLKILVSGPDGSVLFISESSKSQRPEDIRGNLMFFDASSNKLSQVGSDFSGEAAWSLNNQWFALGYDGTTQVIVSAKTTENLAGYVVDNSKLSDDKPRLYPIGIFSNRFMVANSLGLASYLSRDQLANLPLLPDAQKLQAGIFEAGFYISYDPKTGIYSVYIRQNPYQPTIQKVQEYLKSEGYDPLQLKTKWYGEPGVDTGFGLPDNFKPIEEPEPVLTPGTYGD